MNYDFDTVIDRRGTHSYKLDLMPEDLPGETLPLWVADMEFACAPEILDAIRARLDHPILGYTLYGDPDYLTAVCGWFERRHGWIIDPDCLCYAPGVVPAIIAILHMLTSPGDGIVLQPPVFATFREKIEGNGRVAAENPLRCENSCYTMDFADLDDKMSRPENKILLICNPHNPVGRVWTKEELAAAAAICKKYDKWILCDEVHADITRTNISYTPILTAAPGCADRIFVFTSASKAFNIASLMQANIVCPKNMAQPFRQWTADHFAIDGIVPLARDATVAAYTKSADWLDACRAYLDDNIAYVERFLREHLPEAVIASCEGTYLMWVNFSAYFESDAEQEQCLQQEARLYFEKGPVFGTGGSGWERINIACPRSILEEAMRRLLPVCACK